MVLIIRRPTSSSSSFIASDSGQLNWGKYGALSRSEGHSKWFLQKTLLEHDKTMDHPWMQMIYKQVFSLKQYAAWLALNHAVFKGMEETLGGLVNWFAELSAQPKENERCLWYQRSTISCKLRILGKL